ncbi:MAG: hypothetical protein ACPF9I_07040 [Candidatus Thalassarchaeaceae archaeon]
MTQKVWYAVHAEDETDGNVIEKLVNPSLEDLQQAVKGTSPKGYIERVPNKVGFEMFCHEEGLIWQLPQNTVFGSLIGWDNMDSVFNMSMFPNLGTMVIKDNKALRNWMGGSLYRDLENLSSGTGGEEE